MGGLGVVLTLAVVADAGIWVYSKVQANSKSQAKKKSIKKIASRVINKIKILNLSTYNYRYY